MQYASFTINYIKLYVCNFGGWIFHTYIFNPFILSLMARLFIYMYWKYIFQCSTTSPPSKPHEPANPIHDFRTYDINIIRTYFSIEIEARARVQFIRRTCDTTYCRARTDYGERSRRGTSQPVYFNSIIPNQRHNMCCGAHIQQNFTLLYTSRESFR